MTELIVALDVPTFDDAKSLMDELAGLPVVYKVGLEPFCAYGPEIRAELQKSGQGYFLDLKLHDIPRTVEAAMNALIAAGVRIVNVHALGGLEMMVAAVDAAKSRAEELGIEPPEVFAVTILTSIAPEDLHELGLHGGPSENVMRLAALARDAGCTGVICSPLEVEDLKSFFGTDFKTLTPGVRLTPDSSDDQRRTMTPREAAEVGSDYIVVGRPILEAPNRRKAAEDILADLVL